jgi:uncharacterized protein (PEP-CTERM system associated)
MTYGKQLLTLFGLLCISSSSVYGGRWHTNADLDLLSDYTGNVFLESEDTQADLVLRLRPTFWAKREGVRLSVDAKYAPEFRYFVEGTQSNKVVNYFDGNADLLLIKRILGIRARAYSGQSLINNNFNFTQDGFTNPDNVTDTYTLRFTPYIIPIRFGNYATLNAKTDLDIVGYSNSDLESSRGSQLDIALASGAKFSPFKWDLRAKTRVTIYDSDAQNNYDELSAGLHYKLNRAWTLDSVFGVDNLETEGDEDFNRTRWLAGFTWTPNSRSRLEVGAGERFGDTNYLLNFDYKHKHTCWYANYNRDVSSSRGELIDGTSFSTVSRLCNVIDSDTSTGESLGVSFGPTISQGEYLLDKFRIGFNWVRNRTIVDITGQYNRRDYFDANDVSDDWGLFAKINRRMTPRSSLSISALMLYHRNDVETDLDYDQYSATLNYIYNLSQKTNLVFGYRVTNRDNKVGEGFVEDRLNLSLVSTYN